MNETTKKLLELISQGKTVNQISDIMGISHKRLFNYLTMIRNKGFNFDRKYYDTGDIVYVPKKTIVPKEYQGTNIITDRRGTSYTAMVISDLHYGSGFEIEKIMDKIYDYCVKNGIHNIICCGDLIDGTFSRVKQRICDPYDQTEYFLKNYPFDKSILTFTVLGDHDYSVLLQTGQDFSQVLDNYRHDIVSLGYGVGFLNIKKSVITVKHYISNIEVPQIKNGLVLKGHSHSSKFNCFSSCSNVEVPSLSKLNLNQGDSNGLPGAYIITLDFRDDSVKNVTFKQLVILDSIYCINEIVYPFYGGSGFSFDNIEDYSLSSDASKSKWQKVRDKMV